jgi:dolichol-phosphate mannosyltransferase
VTGTSIELLAPEPVSSSVHPYIHTLAQRERLRDQYRQHRDPIADDRLLWRAQSIRQLVHLLPGQTILELASGDGAFTRQLVAVTRGENPITAVSFLQERLSAEALALGSDGDDTSPVMRIVERELPGALAGRQFDCVVGLDLLDRRNSAWLLQQVYNLLEPGGHLVLYESNPWNPMLRLRRLASKLFHGADPRSLLSRTQLYELVSEIGFIRIFAVFNDFMYAPLTKRLAWLLRNLSTVLENAAGIGRLAGSILLHAQKPPRVVKRTTRSLAEHSELFGAVSVVVPCHNEEMNIEPLVQGLREYYDDYIHEIIPVDDNSRDRTAAVLRRLSAEDPRIRPVFRTPPNGVGRAIADGYRAVTGRWVLSMDCDFQHLLPEMRDLFDAAAEGYDVVVGSRFSRHSVLLNYPIQKIIANRGFHLIARMLLPYGFRDMTNNFKLMRAEVVQSLQLMEPGFAVNAETGLQPLAMGYRVKEVPTAWINRAPDMGASSFKLVKAGGGYWQVLRRLWQWRVFGTGAYAKLENVRTSHAD